MKRRCRRHGHDWLLDRDMNVDDFICQEDTCIACGLRRRIHARIPDALVTEGEGGCVHGLAGEVDYEESDLRF